MKMFWSSFREVFVDQSDPNKLMYKYDYMDIDHKNCLFISTYIH